MSEFIFPVIILGSCIGSFLNVVIYRLPKKKSFIFDRSQCKTCKRNLNVLDLFPVISWICLKGRCRYCSSIISIIYPAIEIITSLLFILCLNSIGFNDIFLPSLFMVISGWILVSYLVILCFIDINEMILPNSLTYSGSLVGLSLVSFYNIFIRGSNNNFLLENVFAYFLAFFGFSFFSYIVKQIINKPGFGGGDAKLFAMSGAWLGIHGLEVTVVLSFLISSIFVAFSYLFRLLERGDYIPFGPFICISIFFVWLFGSQFWFDFLGNIFWWKYL